MSTWTTSLYTTKVLDSAGRNTNNNGARGYLPVVIPISGLSSGSHTVKIEASTVGNIHIDALLVPAVTAPTICILKAVKPTDASYVAFYGAGKVDSHRATYNAAIDAVVADCPNDGSILVADANPGWSPAVHQSVDGLHPSTLGMKKEAAAIAAALGDQKFYIMALA